MQMKDTYRTSKSVLFREVDSFAQFLLSEGGFVNSGSKALAFVWKILR